MKDELTDRRETDRREYAAKSKLISIYSQSRRAGLCAGYAAELEAAHAAYKAACAALHTQYLAMLRAIDADCLATQAALDAEYGS